MIAWLVECPCGRTHRLLKLQRTACQCGAIHDSGQQIEFEYVEPRIIRILRHFAIESDVGAGDTVERLITKIGSQPLELLKSKLESLGVDCGCANRKEWLNSNYPW